MPGHLLHRTASIAPGASICLLALWLGGTERAEARDAGAPNPCVNPGVRDGARRTLHDVTATASKLVFCTGEDCWSLDVATAEFTTHSAIKPAAPLAADTPGKSADGRATATPTEVSFCPSGPASCKTFTYSFAFQPQNGLHPMINAQGTLGAVIYAGVGEDREPRYLLTYDLVAGKLIKQFELKANHAAVFRTSFLFNHALYSAKGKKLGKLALPTADISPIPGTDLIALPDIEHASVIFQDTVTGKVHPRIKLGNRIGIDQLVASPDGARLYVIAQGATEGEVFAIDIATKELGAHLAPPPCIAGTARLR
jgi:hypothetical protein